MMTKTRGIYLGAKKLEIGKWQFCLVVESCPPQMIGVFCPHIYFHCAKVHTRPPVGEMITREHYKGVIWDWVLPLDRIVFKTRTFQVWRWRVWLYVNLMEKSHWWSWKLVEGKVQFTGVGVLLHRFLYSLPDVYRINYPVRFW